MSLPQSIDLNSPNKDGYQLMFHFDLNVSPNAEIMAYLKETLGTDTEMTLDGLDLEVFFVNEYFKFFEYLSEQCLVSKENQSSQALRCLRDFCGLNRT